MQEGKQEDEVIIGLRGVSEEEGGGVGLWFWKLLVKHVTPTEEFPWDVDFTKWCGKVVFETVVPEGEAYPFPAIVLTRERAESMHRMLGAFLEGKRDEGTDEEGNEVRSTRLSFIPRK